MAGKIKLSFGCVSFNVRSLLFWSGLLYGRLIFLKIIFKVNFSYLKNGF